MHVYTPVSGNQTDVGCLPLSLFHLTFCGKVSHQTRSSPVWLGWLATEPRGSSFLCPQGLRSRPGLMHSAFYVGAEDLTQVLGFRSSRLYSRHLRLAIAPGLNLFFFFHFMERGRTQCFLYEHSATEPHPRLFPKLLIPKERNWPPSLGSFCLALRSFKGDTHPNPKPPSNQTSQRARDTLLCSQTGRSQGNSPREKPKRCVCSQVPLTGNWEVPDGSLPALVPQTKSLCPRR